MITELIVGDPVLVFFSDRRDCAIGEVCHFENRGGRLMVHVTFDDDARGVMRDVREIMPIRVLAERKSYTFVHDPGRA